MALMPTPPMSTAMLNTAAGVAAPAALPITADAKSTLNQFCQRLTNRPLTKADIVYTTTKFGRQYQAIVKLNCLEGQQEFAGELCHDARKAEHSAANQALVAYQGIIDNLPPTESKFAKKRKLNAAEVSAAKKAKAEDGTEPEGDNPAITPKFKLNSIVTKIIKRFPQKGETEYNCLKVPNGFQGTVKLDALPGEWKGRTWAGHVCATKQKAEQSAAEIALADIEADPTLKEVAAKPKGGGKGKGKGKKGGGKGKGNGNWDWQEWMDPWTMMWNLWGW